MVVVLRTVGIILPSYFCWIIIYWIIWYDSDYAAVFKTLEIMHLATVPEINMDTRIIINGWSMFQMSHKLLGFSLDDQVFFLFNLDMGCLALPVTREVVQYLEIIKDKGVGMNEGVEPARENEMA